jgi:hypothetical protein
VAISDRFVVVAACSFMGYTYDPCMVRFLPALTNSCKRSAWCQPMSKCQYDFLEGQPVLSHASLVLQPADAGTAVACSGSSHPGRQPA